MKKDKVDMSEKTKAGVSTNFLPFLEQELGTTITIMPLFMYSWLFNITYMGWLDTIFTGIIVLGLLYFILYQAAIKQIKEREQKEKINRLEKQELLNSGKSEEKPSNDNEAITITTEQKEESVKEEE